jgi:hypothetical protein
VDGGVPAGRFAAKVLPSTAGLQRKVAGRDFGGLTFQVDTVFVQAACGARARMKKVTDLVNVAARERCYVRNVVISRVKFSSKLESLILAQSERWRQA